MGHRDLGVHDGADVQVRAVSFRGALKRERGQIRFTTGADIDTIVIALLRDHDANHLQIRRISHNPGRTNAPT